MGWWSSSSSSTPEESTKKKDTLENPHSNVLFTSTKCPPGPGLDCSAELPYGLLWSPLQEIRKNDEKVKVPVLKNKEKKHLPAGIVCTTCLAYLNPYCSVVKGKKNVWKCALCGEENVAPPNALKGILAPALTSHTIDYHQEIVGSSKNDKKKNANTTYVLVVDKNLPPSEAHAIVDSLEAALERKKDLGDSSTAKVGLVVYDGTVRLYQLGGGRKGMMAADLFDDEQVDDEWNASLMKKYLMTVDENDKEDAEHDALESLRLALAAVFGDDSNSNENGGARPPTLSRMADLKAKKEARGQKKKGTPIAESPWLLHEQAQQKAQREAGYSKVAPRNVGLALDCALTLAGNNNNNSSGTTTTTTTRLLWFTNGCPSVGDGSVLHKDAAALAVEPKKDDSSGTTANNKNKKKSPSSGWLARKLFKSKKTTGPTLIDRGLLSKAIDYFDDKGKTAYEEEGIGMDVFCSGSNELALAAYQAMVEPSGGYVLPMLSFTKTEQLESNMTWLLEHTYVGRAQAPLGDEDAPATTVSLKDRLLRRQAPANQEDEPPFQGVLLDIRTDSFITPTNLIGPGELQNVPQAEPLANEKWAFDAAMAVAKMEGADAKKRLPNKEALDLSLTRITLGRVDPKATLAVVTQVNDTIEDEDDHAFFQTIARWMDPTGTTLITRVQTHKFPVADEIPDFLVAQNDDVLSALMGKLAVYRSVHGRDESDKTRDLVQVGDAETIEKLAFECQTDIDATIQRISGEFRLLQLEGGVEGDEDEESEDEETEAASSLDKAFPPQLAESLQRLYHLRRGPLISPGPMRSIDDRNETRMLFLRFPLEDCLLMMSPKVWSTGSLEGVRRPTASMKEFPGETLALWDSAIVAADFFDSQCIWSGKQCKPPRYDSVRDSIQDFLQEEGEHRFPKPEVHVLVEGDSMSRKLTARMAPSHADSKDQQLVHFPELADLSEEALKRLRGRFKFYDESADASFRKWFWSVSNATNAVKEAGMHLCE